MIKIAYPGQGNSQLQNLAIPKDLEEILPLSADLLGEERARKEREKKQSEKGVPLHGGLILLAGSEGRGARRKLS
ncbi:MAG: hypothetical protein ACE5H3_11895 [Planctomycetota bacterium]